MCYLLKQECEPQLLEPSNICFISCSLRQISSTKAESESSKITKLESYKRSNREAQDNHALKVCLLTTAPSFVVL